MTLLVLIGIVWGVSALVRASREAKRQREVDRIRREQARRAAEQARMRQEWREAQARAKAETARLIELEREQERQAREQARQAEQLAKHEERIARLEQQVTLAEREIAHYQPIVDELRRQADELTLKVEYYESKGLLCGGYKAQLEKVNNKLYNAETKVIKAQFAKQNAEQKMIA